MRRSSSVRFLLYVLILFNAENDLSTEAVVAGIVRTTLSSFVTSVTVLVKSCLCKKLGSPVGVSHSFLTVDELHNPIRSALSLTKSKSFA